MGEPIAAAGLAEGCRRAVIQNVKPTLAGGQYPVKRIVGERVVVEAEIFADGHDLLSAVLKYRPEWEPAWREIAMESLGNDQWRAAFVATEVGPLRFTIEAWGDRFKSWRNEVSKKLAGGQQLAVEWLVGAELIEAAAQRAAAEDAQWLRRAAEELRAGGPAPQALGEEFAQLMARYPDRSQATVLERELPVSVEPVLARFGAWYELFPRSCAREPGRHGTFKDVEAQLPRVAELGFDVLYLPPIHPIGRKLRKGKNNSTTSQPGDPGSPWSIGAAEGGHKAVHPELGTLQDFQNLVRAARLLGIEIALDIAFQCAPDHPYLKDHPEWFRHRPDGTIQYAENPPKKYEDIYPFDFECADWRGLWRELKSIFEFWIEQGVSVFRVDNPHTKPFRFWAWCLAELKREHPGVIFLSEAFTRPSVKYHLAMLGFTQSYNYFPWRNGREELAAYMTELTQPPVSDFFLANLWPNTPDILTHYLQQGGPAAFRVRLVLAATLGPSYGIYGPAFELCVHQPREPGSEEYLDSEKYELKHWDLASPQSLAPLIRHINQLRREHAALQMNYQLRFHRTDNEQLLAYSKTTPDGQDTLLIVVNLDPYHRHYGWLELPLETLGLSAWQTYQMHDLLSEARYLWRGPRNYVELDPQKSPAHILCLRRWMRTERDFDYFM